MVLFSEDHIQETKRRGRIEVICGSMFSGKTEELIRRMKRAKFARQRVEIFKPAIDTRYLRDIVRLYDSTRPVTFGASYPSKSAINGTELQVDVHGMNYPSGYSSPHCSFPIPINSRLKGAGCPISARTFPQVVFISPLANSMRSSAS